MYEVISQAKRDFIMVHRNLLEMERGQKCFSFRFKCIQLNRNTDMNRASSDSNTESIHLGSNISSTTAFTYTEYN